MFDRIGDKLISVGVWTVVAGCIGSILLGLLVLRSNPLLALLIGVFGCAGSVLFGMIVYGLGTLICNTEELLALARKEDLYPVSTVEDRKSFAPVRVVPDEEGKITCPACGSVQQKDRKECWSCGQAFRVVK